MNSRKNILFIASNIPTPKKGNNNIILRIAEKLRIEYDVEILFPKPWVPFGFHLMKKHRGYYQLKDWDYKEMRIKPLTYIRIPLWKWAFVLLKKQYLNVNFEYYRNRIDIIHSHFLFPDGIIASIISKEINVPYVITLRGYDARKIERMIEDESNFLLGRAVIRGAFAVTCLNHYQKEIIQKRYGVESVVIPHGILESEIVHQIPEIKDTVTICTAGAANKDKNIHWVIRAVKSYTGNKKVKCIVIGDGDFRPIWEKEAGDDSRIIFKGKISRQQVLTVMTKSDIFALPSVNETFGLVYLEAAAKGNAIIGTKKDGIWKLFNNSEAVYTISYTHFEEQLHQLIDDSVKLKGLAANANKKVRSYSWNAILKKYNRIYNSIIKN